MILDIVQIGDPVLRRKAHKITQIDRDIRLLAEDMVQFDIDRTQLLHYLCVEEIRTVVVLLHSRLIIAPSYHGR